MFTTVVFDIMPNPEIFSGCHHKALHPYVPMKI